MACVVKQGIMGSLVAVILNQRSPAGKDQCSLTAMATCSALLYYPFTGLWNSECRTTLRSQAPKASHSDAQESGQEESDEADDEEQESNGGDVAASPQQHLRVQPSPSSSR